MISQCMKWLCTLAGGKKVEEACLIKCKVLVIHHWFSCTVHLTKLHAKSWARVPPLFFPLNSSQLHNTFLEMGNAGPDLFHEAIFLPRASYTGYELNVHHLGKMGSACSCPETSDLDFFFFHGLASVKEGLEYRAANWLTGRQVTSGADWSVLHFKDILRQSKLSN